MTITGTRLSVLKAVQAASEPFAFAEIAATVGAPVAGSPGYQRARRAFQRLLDAGAVERVGRGRFVVLDTASADGAMGPGVALRERALAALYDLGGYARRRELAQALGISGDDADALSALSRALAADPRFESGTPIDGFRTVWRMRADLLRRAALGGRWLRLDMRIALIRINGLSDAWTGAGADLDLLFARIGAGVAEARQGAGVEVSELLRGATGAAFRQGLDGAQGELRRWWAALRPQGEEGLERAWLALERPDDVEPAVVESCTVAFWRALAADVGAEGADLSRGLQPD